MTNLEFIGYKLILQREYTDVIYTLINRVKIGKNIDKEISDMLIVDYLLYMLSDYHLFTEDETDFNHLTVAEMNDINFYINKILRLTNNPNFNLE